ncbi:MULTISPECIES: class I adenylate-forming enzyme family protein [Vibrio]|uniref:Long-chain fatty acid--CoA ligase n=1 Tax=Vibrio splendidus TaxID=29497 RepID=A0A2T5E6X0_VIBSP|nr:MULTISPECIES: AMP-binding protein [Vibrio]MCT4349494.1 AMP-binding protein [Vibrio sp. NC2]MCW4441194.1 AMP-binding protein [Vibrio splendidus]OEE57307.1 rfbL protein [Vibrio splendidus FF-6]PTP15070.1 long-chain fatty acid--CoA ligase [Vibrio splendidus]SBS65293.1 putative sulfoacetate--CoA ligase [Vibrio splendidus]
MSVVETILAHAASRPQHIALYEKSTAVTYTQLAETIKRTASKLMRDVEPGDAVLVTASNSYAFVAVYFAIHYIGAKVVNLAADIDESYKQFIDSKVNPSLSIEDCQAYIADVNDQMIELEVISNVSSGIADLMFTSGTTGEPKGVALSHQQLLTATQHIVDEVRNTSDDIELLLMPLSHSFGMGRMRTTLFSGGTLVLGYPLQRLKSVFKAIEEHRVTGLGLVPSAWAFITTMSKNRITKYASQLNYIEFGSAHLSPEDKKLLTQWFPSTHIVMHYGLTEISRAVFTHFHTDNLDAVGHVSRGAEFVILGEDGQLLPEGEIGEIAFKAPWMLTEYYQNHDLTSAAFANGYFRTGDLGKHEGEYLFLTGRLKEIINVGGKKVSPYQIEEVLNSDDGVIESACVPHADPSMGEVVQAFIVVEPSISDEIHTLEMRLRASVAQRLPVHMRPEKYQVIDELPKTSTGKIQRLHLTKM